MEIIRDKFTAEHLGSNARMMKCISKDWGTGATL